MKIYWVTKHAEGKVYTASYSEYYKVRKREKKQRRKKGERTESKKDRIRNKINKKDE